MTETDRGDVRLWDAIVRAEARSLSSTLCRASPTATLIYPRYQRPAIGSNGGVDKCGLSVPVECWKEPTATNCKTSTKQCRPKQPRGALARDCQPIQRYKQTNRTKCDPKARTTEWWSRARLGYMYWSCSSSQRLFGRLNDEQAKHSFTGVWG